MAKRRLTHQQKRRIQSRQQKQLQTLSDADMTKIIPPNHLGTEQTGLVITHYGKFIDIETTDGTIHRCNLRQNLENIIIGDKVLWRLERNQLGVVIGLLPRTTLLWRMDAYHKKKAIAANIDQIMVVNALKPSPNFLLLDSYLVVAELNQIKPVLVINKIDLLDSANCIDALRDFLAYKKIGYDLIQTSCYQHHGLDHLLRVLQNHNSVFVGQSGVGKSSLINALIPDLNLPVGNLVEISEMGAHTTTASRLIHLPSGGDVIDSPGLREFTLSEQDPQVIMQGFKEFQPYLGQCKFHNCKHIKEPGCAILKAIEAGLISNSRYNSYRHLITN